MYLAFKKTEALKNKQTNQTENSIYTLITDCSRQTKGQTEPTITTSGVGLADGLFCMLRKKKRKTRVWWESLFTFMYQQISLRCRRNITRVSNVWKAAPIHLFRLGPQRSQRNNGKVFRIFLQPDWQIDNGFFITPVMAHRWGNKTEIFVTKISALFRRRALPRLFED